MTTAGTSELPSTYATLEDDDLSYKAELTSAHLNPTAGLEFVKCPSAGAIVYFGGTTRDTFPLVKASGDGSAASEVEIKKVAQLEYEAYVPMALRTLQRIALKALAYRGSPGIGSSNTEVSLTDPSWPNHVCKVYIAHRLGIVPVCEESVVIAISAPHRKEGWMCAEWILEEVKRSAEIWKNEVYEDGTALWKANDGSKPAGYETKQ